MKVRTSILAVLLALGLCLTVPSVAAAEGNGQGHAAAIRGALSIPIAGTASTGGAFAGTLTITRFIQHNGTVYAVGTVVGNVAGSATTAVTAVVIPITADPTCPILHLHTGAISLDVLGLTVNIAPITIDISAQSGAGNLLGNLLCDIANLLNNPAALTSALNQLLSLLSGL